MSINSDAEERLKEIVELSRLYDVYGALLSDHNRVIFEDYVLNDYSLAEIAEEVELSRQGVRDIVVRCSGKLREYENKLGFLKKIDETGVMLDDVFTMITEGHYEADKAVDLIKKAHERLDM